jgi:hypothetical protein
MVALLLTGFFWIAVLCLLTSISAGPAMVLGLLAVMAGGLVSSLTGPRPRRGPGCGD